MSPPSNQSININEKDCCFTPLSFSQKSTLSFSQEYIPIYHYVRFSLVLSHLA